ncbi:hypothetical protein ACIBTP_39325, partial [Streptomyces avidinii]|uniref:hypothetical protein n=1 Tax=Streptomyces avidinii TaxID=1895 RepID=UPI0037AC8DE4
SGCPQLQPNCCDSGLVQVFHLHSNQQRFTAQTESEPEPGLWVLAQILGSRRGVVLEQVKREAGEAGELAGVDRVDPSKERGVEAA